MRLTISSNGDNGLKITLGNVFNYVISFGNRVSRVLFLAALFDRIKGATAQQCAFNHGDLTGTTLCAQNAERTVTVAIELSPDVLPTVVNAIKNFLIKGVNGVTYIAGSCNRLVYEAPIAGTGSKVTSNDCYTANDIAPQITGIFQSTTTTTAASNTQVASTIGQTISTGLNTLTSAISGQTNPTSNPRTNSHTGMPVWLWAVFIIAGASFIIAVGLLVSHCCNTNDNAQPARRRDGVARAEAGEGTNLLLSNVADASPNALLAARIKDAQLRGEPSPVQATRVPRVETRPEVGQGGVNEVDTVAVYADERGQRTPSPTYR